MNLDEIDNRFSFHPANEITGPKHDDIRQICHNVAVHLDSRLPEGREKALAYTHLEEVMFWANAAIARQSDAVS